MQTDLRREFKGLYTKLSLHEIKQNPELELATKRLKRALSELKRRMREHEQENLEGQIEKGIA